MAVPTDPALAVLRDIEHIVWLTLVLGLPLFAGWRWLAGKKTAPAPPAEAGTRTWSDAPRGPAGRPFVPRLDVSHFTWFEIAILPLVLIKYSATLQWLAASAVQSIVPSPANAAPGIAGDPASGTWTSTMLTADFALNLLLVFLIVVAIQVSSRRGVGEVFGLTRLPPLHLALWIAAGALTVTPVVLVVSNAIPDWITPLFGENIQEQAAVENLRKAAGDTSIQWFLIFNAVLVAPVVEEVVFRGFFYGALKRKSSTLFAAFITAALFAAAHNNLLAFLPLFGFALFLTLFYEATGSLWVPIGMHAVFNAVNVGLILSGVGGGRGG